MMLFLLFTHKASVDWHKHVITVYLPVVTCKSLDHPGHTPRLPAGAAIFTETKMTYPQQQSATSHKLLPKIAALKLKKRCLKNWVTF